MALLTSTVTLVVGGLAASAAALGVHSASPSGIEDGLTVPCGAVFQRLPDALQDDITDLEAMSPAERRVALLEIRREALTGGYGDRVQHFAERRDERRAEILKRLPAELRQDLREARRLPIDERAAAYAEISDQALAGDYGERVQQGAERIQERRAACAA